MSYLRKYTVVPDKSFKVLRNCAGCGCKTTYINTNNFRVNANGNRIDVWLIYQCENCKHTANLTIYERQRPSSIDKKKYQKFLVNDKELAYQYGTDNHFFAQNKAVIDWNDISYHIEPDHEVDSEEKFIIQEGDHIEINCIGTLKVRMDKLVSETLHITRSKLKDLERQGILRIVEDRIAHIIHVNIEKNIEQ